MKRILSLVLVFILTFALFSACGKKEERDPNQLTIDKGYLKVGTEAGYPPMEYVDSDGSTYIGFDIELAEEIAKKLDLKLKIVNTGWDGIFTSLDSNRYDCIISAVSVTPERMEDYNLSKPYISNKICIVTKNDSGITKPEDLAGKKVGTQTDTTADHFMQGLIKDGLAIDSKDYSVYDQILNCFSDLKLGRLDAVVVDNVVAAYYLGEDSDKFTQVWQSEDSEPMAITVKKGNDKLSEAIEKAVDELYAEGKVAEIAKKYFGENNKVTVER